ncbi:MAG: endonuclease III [Clostridiales bacterium]|jgi:endonuclease-3|nr:endonuclease III [Clostridiales bacterium]
MDGETAELIFARLFAAYGEQGCALRYGTPFQLLAATILSAQCTDKRVNEVTPPLFAAHRSAADFAALTEAELEGYIRSCGFYREKAKSILSAARDVVARFGGEVPAEMDALLRLRGVGRKTASVLLVEAFKVPAVPVDTHVFRVSRRLGMSGGTTPEAVERELRALWQPRHYIGWHHLLIHHGRVTCKSQSPQCAVCPVQALCAASTF